MKLPATWSEGVYMEHIIPEDPNAANTIPVGNHGDNPDIIPKRGSYILINSGENIPQGQDPQVAGPSGEVFVIDAVSPEKNPIQNRIKVGPSPGHAYGVFNRNQVRIHFLVLLACVLVQKSIFESEL
jgi:hypothetical protein